MDFELKDKNFPSQTKLTAKEIETYRSIYNKEYDNHEIKIYSGENKYSSYLSLYELFVFHKRFLDYIFPEGWNIKDEFLYTHINDVKNGLKNGQYKPNEYLDFLFTLVVNNTCVVAKPIPVERNYAILIKENFLDEFVTIKEKTHYLLENIILHDDFTSVLPISEMDFTDPDKCCSAIMLFLDKYFNIEQLRKNDSHDGVTFKQYIGFYYSLALTSLLMFYIYQHDLYNNKIDVKDRKFILLNFEKLPYGNRLIELWFKNLAPRLSK